jgi:broad specificity phosphatase PhoE
MSSITQLLLVRHAEVETRYHRVFGGRIDMGLSPRGHEQSTALAKYLSGRHFDAIYASPMKRVQETIQPLLAVKEHRPVILPGLREVDFGDWTGLGWEDVQKRFGESPFEWLEKMARDGFPNGENELAFRSRVEPCVEQILRDHSGQKILVACHGGTVRMILFILLNLALPKTTHFEVDYASLTKVEINPQRRQIELLNLTPWRDIR